MSYAHTHTHTCTHTPIPKCLLDTPINTCANYLGAIVLKALMLNLQAFMHT